MTTIRSMREEDAAQVAPFLAGSWRRTYAPLLGRETVAEASARLHTPARLAAEAGDPALASFVAVDDGGAIAGYALTQTDEKGEAWLDRLHVDPARFGTGLAARLLDAVVSACAGAPSLALEVVEGNDRAIAFYRKHGFAVTERLDTCGDIDGAPTLVMRRSLAR